jgi:hypothetical protein
MTREISSVFNKKLQRRLLKRSNEMCSWCGSNKRNMNKDSIKYLLPDRTYIEVHRCNICGSVFENVEALDSYAKSLKVD